MQEAVLENLGQIQELMGKIQELMAEIQELMVEIQELMENRYYLNCSAIKKKMKVCISSKVFQTPLPPKVWTKNRISFLYVYLNYIFSLQKLYNSE